MAPHVVPAKTNKEDLTEVDPARATGTVPQWPRMRYLVSEESDSLKRTSRVCPKSPSRGYASGPENIQWVIACLVESLAAAENVSLRRRLTRRFVSLPRAEQRLGQVDETRLESWADRVLE